MILLVCGCYVVFVGPIAVVNMTDAVGEKSGCLKLFFSDCNPLIIIVIINYKRNELIILHIFCIDWIILDYYCIKLKLSK